MVPICAERLRMKKINGTVLRHILATMVLACSHIVWVLPSVASAEPTAVVRGLPDFTELVEQVGPSVVNIRTIEKNPSRAKPKGLDDDVTELFRRFGLPAPHAPRQQRPQRPPNPAGQAVHR